MKLLLSIILITTISSSLQGAEMSKECPLTKFKGSFNHKDLSEMDLACFKTAKRRCGELYENSPCLKIFTKTGEYSYTAICGSVSK